MIKLNHIQISFEHDVLVDSSIEFHRGSITGIKGESGAGKSSLLDIISLFCYNGQCDYEMDGINLKELSLQDLNQIKRNKIAYLRQDCVLLPYLSCLNLLIYEAKICGKELSLKKAKQILDNVGLIEQADSYPEKLSGGEEQRLSIALAIAKDADIIICDEITSMLDDDNTKSVLNLLKKIAHEQNKIVIMASHEDNVISEMDALYQIDNKHIICIKNDNKQDEGISSINSDNVKGHSFFYFGMTNKVKKKKIQTFLIVLLTSISIAMLWFSNAVSNEDNANIQKNIEGMLRNNLFVYSFTGETEGVFEPFYDQISDEVKEAINNVEGVIKIMDLYGLQIANHNDIFSQQKFEFDLIKNGARRTVTLSLEEASGILSNGASVDYQNIIPYYNEDTLYNASMIKDKNKKGAYLNYELAWELGIDESWGLSETDFQDGTILEMDIYVPVAQKDDILTTITTSGKVTVNIKNPIYQKVKMQVELAGVLDPNYLDEAFTYGPSVLYIPQETFDSLVQEGKSAYTLASDEEPFASRSIRVFYDNERSKKEIMNDIHKIDANIHVSGRAEKVASVGDAIQDVDRMYKGGSLLLSFIVLLFVFVFGFQHRKEYYQSLLFYKLRGFNDKETRSLVFIEMLIYALFFAVGSILVSNYLKIFGIGTQMQLVSSTHLTSSFVYMLCHNIIFSFICAFIIELPTFIKKEGTYD